MKIVIRTGEDVEDMEVVIACRAMTPELEKVIATLRMLDRQVTARRNGEIFLLDASDILYADTVDKKNFVYKSLQVFESDLRLGELEHQLEAMGFLRAGKSCILNMRHIRSLKADYDRRIKVTMENGEQLVVSRQYAQELKRRLGVS